MTKEDNKLAFALLNLYVKLYVEKYGRQPLINKYRDKWAANDVVGQLGYDRARVIMDYYFHTTSQNGHSLQWFFNNFDRLEDMKQKLEQDSLRRAKMLEETRKMMEARNNV